MSSDTEALEVLSGPNGALILRLTPPQATAGQRASEAERAFCVLRDAAWATIPDPTQRQALLAAADSWSRACVRQALRERAAAAGGALV
jgi:hypothetical protein